MQGLWRASLSLVMPAAMAQVTPPSGASPGNQDATSADPTPVDPAARSNTATYGDVFVTGSRAIVEGAHAPTPVTVVSAAQLETANPGTIARGLNQLSAFRESSNAATGQTSSSTANSRSFVNLRNLGPQRLLILLGGIYASGRPVDRLVRRSPGAYGTVPAVATAVSLPFFLGFVTAPTWPIALALLAVPLFCDYSYLTPAGALVQARVPAERRPIR